MKPVNPDVVSNQAKKLKKHLDGKQTEALELISQMYGFPNYFTLQQAWKNYSEIPKELAFLKNVEDGWRHVNHYKEHIKALDQMDYDEYDIKPYIYVLSKLNYLPACELFETYFSILDRSEDVTVANTALHAVHYCGSTGTNKCQSVDILDMAKNDPDKLADYSETMLIDLDRPIEDEFNVFSELELISIDNKLGVWLPDLIYPERKLLTFKNFTDKEATKRFLDTMDVLTR